MWNLWNNRIKNVYVSLRFSILSVFISLLLIITLLIVWVRGIAFEDGLTFTARALMQDASNAVLRELSERIRLAESQARFAASLIAENVVDPQGEEISSYTFYLINTMSLVHSAYWGDEAGSFVHSQKMSDGTIATEMISVHDHTRKRINIIKNNQGQTIKNEIVSDDGFDHRNENWYVNAKQTLQAGWTQLYGLHPDKAKGISYGIPILNTDRSLNGVFGLDIDFTSLTQFITNQQISQHGYSFIIDGNENLVVYPERYPFTQIAVDRNQEVNVHRLALPIIDKTIDYYKKTGKEEFEYRYQRKNYLVTYQPVPDLTNKGWLVGVISEKKDFTGILDKVNSITLIICFVTMLLGIVIVSRLVSRIIKPIYALSNEADKIKHFELEGDVLSHSHIKEVHELETAIIAMKRGLRQFQKYVPRQLVRQLIESKQESEIGGTRRELVVLFADIENFTTISESMDPNALMMQLCEYFEVITKIIHEEKGTIDKFIGDSVMVFWGAPLMLDEPCQHAARAALRIQRAIDTLNDSWQQSGKPVFKTRIGIHAGEAIVGNLGSSDRINYTALGDTVNIASRLEGINKQYHTRILVSDVVYQDIKNNYELKKMDEVIVKGRSTPVIIYELIQ